MQLLEIHKLLKLVNMAGALPNVTRGVLVVGLRLGMAEQHIFQCVVFLYPRTSETTRCLLASSDSAQRDLQPNLVACSYIPPLMSPGPH